MKLGRVELGLYGGYHKMKITEYDVVLQQLVERDLTQEEIDSINEAEERCNSRVVTEIGE
jgi:hypothetical protein